MANIFKLAKDLVSYTSERQKVLSSNVARANIPKEKAYDLPPFEVAMRNTKNSKISINTTNSMHLESKIAGSRFKAQKDRLATDMTPTGNNIVLSDQAAKINENTNDHQLATSVYKKMMTMYKSIFRAG